jgi:hypothetical protein
MALYEGVPKSFRTGRLKRELQMVQLPATTCSCIAILWVSLVSFVAITLCVASQRMFIVDVVYFVIDSVRKLLDTPSYLGKHMDKFTFTYEKQGIWRHVRVRLRPLATFNQADTWCTRCRGVATTWRWHTQRHPRSGTEELNKSGFLAVSFCRI